jgi:dihydroflavonol-4-reductase
VGSWILKKFYDSGKYKVRATIRDANDEAKVKEVKKAIGNENAKIEFFSVELEDAESMVKAFEGCDYVVHTAFPMPLIRPHDLEGEIYTPAVSGTENAIKACWENDVKRIILTSGTSTLLNAENMKKEMDEEDWAELSPTFKGIPRGKYLAEQNAWEMHNQQPEGKSLEMVTLVGGSAFGAPLLERK